MNNYDSPVLNGQRYNVEIDSKTHTLKFSQQLFSQSTYFMTVKNSSFKKNNERRKGLFNLTNKLRRIDDVQKNIIGILPF